MTIESSKDHLTIIWMRAGSSELLGGNDAVLKGSTRQKLEKPLALFSSVTKLKRLASFVGKPSPSVIFSSEDAGAVATARYVSRQWRSPLGPFRRQDSFENRKSQFTKVSLSRLAQRSFVGTSMPSINDPTIRTLVLVTHEDNIIKDFGAMPKVVRAALRDVTFPFARTQTMAVQFKMTAEDSFEDLSNKLNAIKQQELEQEQHQSKGSKSTEKGEVNNFSLSVNLIGANGASQQLDL